MITEYKTIYFIRHAESQNNKDKKTLKDAFYNITQGKIPTKSPFGAIVRCSQIPMDSEISEKGKEQISIQRGNLRRDNFLEKNNIEIIFHSPLIRSLITCHELFKVRFKSSSSRIKLKEYSELYEQCISEWIGYNNMEDRVLKVKTQLLERYEKSIVLVGHNTFFRKLLDLEDNIKIENCSIWKANLNSNGEWSNIIQIYEGGDQLINYY